MWELAWALLEVAKLAPKGKPCSLRGMNSFVIPTKSFVKIGITKIFSYNNKMFSFINKTFGCCSKMFGCSNKKKYVLFPICLLYTSDAADE